VARLPIRPETCTVSGATGDKGSSSLSMMTSASRESISTRFELGILLILEMCRRGRSVAWRGNVEGTCRLTAGEAPNCLGVHEVSSDGVTLDYLIFGEGMS
jgi:hypothetical protein